MKSGVKMKLKVFKEFSEGQFYLVRKSPRPPLSERTISREFISISPAPVRECSHSWMFGETEEGLGSLEDLLSVLASLSL